MIDDSKRELPAAPTDAVETPPPKDSVPRPEYPNSSAVSGLCSAAIALFAIIVAFIGYTAYSGTGAGGPWGWQDLWHLVPAGVAAMALVSVPWFATEPELANNKGHALDRARVVFLVGGVCTILALGIFIGRDVCNSLTLNHPYPVHGSM